MSALRHRRRAKKAVINVACFLLYSLIGAAFWLLLIGTFTAGPRP